MNKFYTIFFLLAAVTLSAQDLHLTNYQPAGMLFNPALTAAGKYDAQIGAQYRTQWANIKGGFTTIGTTAELKFRQLGMGFLVHQNQAGPASLKTTGLMLTGAYHKPLAQDGSLSLGFGIGRLQKKVNPALLTFDNQYAEAVGYDSSLPSNETFERTTASFADFSTGLLWQGQWGTTNNLKSTLGVSLSHFHLPNVGLLGETYDLPMRTTINGSVDMKIDNHFILTPHFLLQKQGTHREFLAGVKINGTFDKNSDFNAGMSYRSNDAVILQVGMEIGNKSIWASYDANVSPIEGAAGGTGALELGLYLRFGDSRKKELKDTDGDGTYDNRDKCPKVPGPKDNQGCPVTDTSLDADKDGIPDNLDQCPLEPGEARYHGCNDKDGDGIYDSEDACPEIFGYFENKGCPIFDRDTDRDGVPDRDDHCLYIKGIPELNGCPDTDKDGISDIEDHCPYLKGLPEHDGCPTAALAAGVGVEPNVVVEFATDLSFITSDFKAMLDDFAEQVKAMPEAQIIVSGHTDAEGNIGYNYELGLRRAKAVQDYLRRKGVPAEQLEIISYGEAMPRHNNSTVEGRAENRRAEVALVK